jgi:hypothetical protein
MGKSSTSAAAFVSLKGPNFNLPRRLFWVLALPLAALTVSLIWMHFYLAMENNRGLSDLTFSSCLAGFSGVLIALCVGMAAAAAAADLALDLEALGGSRRHGVVVLFLVSLSPALGLLPVAWLAQGGGVHPELTITGFVAGAVAVWISFLRSLPLYLGR